MSLDLRHAVFAFVAFILGLLAGNIWRPMPPDAKAWEARVVAYQRDSADTEKVLATLHGTVARLEDSARTLRTERAVLVSQADAARRAAGQSKLRADSLHSALANQRTATDSLPVVVAAYEARTDEANQAHAEADTLRSALGNAVQESIILRGVIKTQDSVIVTVTKRLAIADDLLRDRPKTDRCKVLWFDCPSRTATFIVGAVLGAGASAYVATR